MSEKTLPERMKEAAVTLREVADRDPRFGGKTIASMLESRAEAWAYGSVYAKGVSTDDANVYVTLPDGGVVAVYVGARYSKGYFVQTLSFVPPNAVEVWTR